MINNMEHLNTYLSEITINNVKYAGVDVEAKTEKEAILLLYIHGYENYKIAGRLIETINENIE